MEHELLLAIPDEIERYGVLGDMKAKLFQYVVVPVKPLIQRFKRCETAVLPRLDSLQLRIVLWTGMRTPPMILKHCFQSLFKLCPIRAVATALFDPQN